MGFEEIAANQRETQLEEFLKTARLRLAPYSEHIGLVIYSPVGTLAPNPLLFWGFNPGQDPNVTDPTHWTIAEALTRFPTQTESLLMQCWPDARGGTTAEGAQQVYRKSFPPGGAPYQRGIRHLFSAIRQSRDGTHSPEPLVTNFLFLQTPSAKQAGKIENIGTIVQNCWRVHEAIFEIAQPRILITSAGVLDYVRRFSLMPLEATNKSIHSGYSNWRCKKWETEVKHGGMTILQVPHMSYWGGCIGNDQSREAVAWVVQIVGELCPVADLRY